MTRRIVLALVLACVASGAYAGVDLPPWVREAARAKVPEGTGAAAAVLLDETVVTVKSADEIVTRYRRVMKILTAAGRGFGYAGVGFDRSSKLLSLRGWSIDARGQMYEVRERDAVETSPFDFELYSDARMKVLRIPASDIGSVVAYEWEKRERPYQLQMTWQFQEDLPVSVARLQLSLPEGWSYDARWRQHPGVPPANGGWEVRDVAALGDEPGRPATLSLAGRLGLQFLPPSSRATHSWSGLGKWFGDLAAPRSAPTPEIRAMARQLTSGATDRVRALARFAQRDVRYVAVEIGIGGYQPHAAGDILKNRYGDCKDKATLLRTMLREIGVESYYVLVHTTRGTVPADLPLLGDFNHVILAIAAPDQKPVASLVQHSRLGPLTLFDPTSTVTPFGNLPSYLQNSRGLLVTAGGGEPIELPSHTPEANQLRRSAKLRLDALGTLTGEVAERRTGHLAAELRMTLQPLTAQERARYVEQILAHNLANYTTSGIAFENLDDAEQDLLIRYSVNAPSYAKRVADMTLVRPRVLGRKAESILDLTKRKHGYVTDGPSVQTDEIEIVLDPRLIVDELPKPVKLTSPALRYDSESSFDKGVLRYRRRYELQTWFVAREELPKLNEAFREILADERASAVLK